MGIGSGIRLEQMGVAAPRRITAVRDTIHIVSRLLRGETRNARTRYLMPLAFAAIATTTLSDRYTSGGANERIPGEAAERGWGNQ